MRRCDGCTSYALGGDGLGHCHFLPPSQHRDARNAMWTPFPLVNPDWWCSQHEARPVDLKVNVPTPALVAPEDDF